MTSTAAPLDPGPLAATTPVVFSHPAPDEPATHAADGEKARHILFSAPTAVRAGRPQR